MNERRESLQHTSRRSFLSSSAGTMIGLAAAGSSVASAAAPDSSGQSALPVKGAGPSVAAGTPAAGSAVRRRPRVGTATISFRHAVKTWQQEGFAAMKFLEASHRAGAEVVMIYDFILNPLDADQLKQLRQRAESLDVAIEASGQNLFRPTYEQTMEQVAALGAKTIGAYSGMLLRPEKIPTLELWDEHQAKTEARLRELLPLAKRLGIVIALENHLDFTMEEICQLIRRIDSPHVRLLFDVGNGIATLDDPIESAEQVGPLVAATHFKDFAIEEVTRGFRFTMVPLGAGSLQLREVCRRLLPNIAPGTHFSIEMMNGQQFEVKWLEERYWPPYRGVTARQLAATLRHIRGKAIDIERFVPEKELETLPHDEHMEFEFRRIRDCIATLKQILDELTAGPAQPA
ncbi:MAG: sugar phosphate isomerase/epimerase family protein [Planctomycetota bacterium]